MVEGFNAGISYSVAQLLVDDGDVQWAGASTRLAKNIGVAQRADVKAIVDKAITDTAPLLNVVIGIWLLCYLGPRWVASRRFDYLVRESAIDVLERRRTPREVPAATDATPP